MGSFPYLIIKRNMIISNNCPFRCDSVDGTYVPVCCFVDV